MAESVAEVRRAFDSWRRQKSSKERVYPESLRRRALSVSWDGTDGELSAALGLSHVAVLRNWRKQGASGKAMVVKTAQRTENQGQFVEVATLGELGLATTKVNATRSLEVVLESGDGRSVRVRGELDAAMLKDLAQVALGDIGSGVVQR